MKRYGLIRKLEGKEFLLCTRSKENLEQMKKNDNYHIPNTLEIKEL